MLALMILYSCRGKAGHENNEAARQLFIKSKHLTEEYIDSLEHAKDSASVNKMLDNFNIKLTTVNYQFPADTDLDLTEEENDSLIRMFNRMESTVARRLKSLGSKESTDSLANDSILSDKVAVKTVTSVKTTKLPSHTDGN